MPASRRQARGRRAAGGRGGLAGAAACRPRPRRRRAGRSRARRRPQVLAGTASRRHRRRGRRPGTRPGEYKEQIIWPTSDDLLRAGPCTNVSVDRSAVTRHHRQTSPSASRRSGRACHAHSSGKQSVAERRVGATPRPGRRRRPRRRRRTRTPGRRWCGRGRGAPARRNGRPGRSCDRRERRVGQPDRWPTTPSQISAVMAG